MAPTLQQILDVKLLPGLRLGGSDCQYAIVDATARAILRAWAKQPWCDIHRLALADQLADLGLSDASQFVLSYRSLCSRRNGDHLPRRARQRMLRQWRGYLETLFGDYENTLPEAPADTGAPTQAER